MAPVSFEHAGAVRAALRAIVSDPAHGPDALSSPRVMASLLSDFLPDAPRESGLLTAAVQRDIAGMLREHLSNGLGADVAVGLAAASFANSTAFTPEACQWVTAEIAIALGVDVPEQAEARPSDKATTALNNPDKGLPASGVTRQSPEGPSTQPAGAAERKPAQHPPPPEPVLAPAAVPQPPQEAGWRLAIPLPGTYGTRDCPRCGRRLPKEAVGRPHTSAGRLWCPGILGVHYADRGGFLQYVAWPSDDPQPAGPEDDQPAAQPQAAAEAAQNAAARLAEVGRLHAAGLLTDQEYADKRQEIIRQL